MIGACSCLRGHSAVRCTGVKIMSTCINKKVSHSESLLITTEIGPQRPKHATTKKRYFRQFFNICINTKKKILLSIFHTFDLIIRFIETSTLVKNFSEMWWPLEIMLTQLSITRQGIDTVLRYGPLLCIPFALFQTIRSSCAL